MGVSGQHAYLVRRAATAVVRADVNPYPVSGTDWAQSGDPFRAMSGRVRHTRPPWGSAIASPRFGARWVQAADKMSAAMTKTPAQRSRGAARQPSVAARRRRAEVSSDGSVRLAADGQRFPVVGIGASAGGLDAFKKLFGAMPVDSGMAFVLIPHLDPTHESLMVELLAKQTTMPVAEARDGTPVHPNHVYVIPPNADLALKDRVLRVVPPPPRRGSQTAIDFFLRSLAADQQARAVGIILSGTGSHGTVGVRAIKAAGGMVIAQTPESAEHDQMPRSAIATGLVDHVLPPEQMPQALARHAAQPAAPTSAPATEDLSQILSLLRTQAKRDFRGYRPSMLLRRVRRRMGLCRVDGVTSYVDYLRAHPDEVHALSRDLSIGVTAAAAVAELMHRALLADFAPAAVLINQRYQILSVQGPVVDYLEFPPGELTRDLLAMARPGLRTAIRGVCQHAMQTHHVVVDAKARVKRQSTYVSCTVTARPVGGAKDAEGLLLVTFQDRPARRAEVAKRPAHADAPRRGDESTLVRQLEHELQATRDDLQGTIDELQTANEELKASHEEVMSMNEELQSTNEELSTVNSQLQDKVHELDAANNDMVNLLASTDIATVFLDADLRIKRFTPPTARLLNLLATDLGRPFRDIAPRVTDAALLDDCRRVIEKLAPIETLVRADDAEAYLRRVLPYRTADNRIDGVVITWVDITRRLAADAESRRLTAVLRDSNDAVALLDLEGRITGWNRGAERLYGYTEAETRRMYVRDLAPEPHRDAMDDLIGRMASGEVASESVDTQRTTKDGRTRDIWLTMTLLRDATGQPDAIVTTERDVTELKEGLAARQAAQLYQQVIEHLPAGAVLREDDRITMNRAAEAITGYERNELPTVDVWCATLHGDQAQELCPRYETSRTGERAAQAVSLAIGRKDGQTRHVELTVCRLDHTHELWMLLDLTEQDRAAQTLRRSEDYLRSIVATAVDAIITIDERGTIDTFNPAAERMFGYTAAEVAGRNVRLLMPPPYRDEHDGHLARYVKTGEARIIGIGREVVGLRKDGTTFPLDLAVSEVDHRRRFTGILRDLSDRRELEWRLAESQLEERRHMARELHDDIGGYVTGIGLLAQSLQAELEKAKSPAAVRAQELIQSISQAHQRLRSVIRGLMPVEAIPEGLMAALEKLARQCETVSGIPCRFQCERPVLVEDPMTAKHLFRIAQEAINNAVRHGQPAQITLSLTQDGQQLGIVVTDDGRGFEEPPAGHSGIGLTSMRQRARLLGGECTVQPREGGGTTVRCWVRWPKLVTRSGATAQSPRRGVTVDDVVAK